MSEVTKVQQEGAPVSSRDQMAELFLAATNETALDDSDDLSKDLDEAEGLTDNSTSNEEVEGTDEESDGNDKEEVDEEGELSWAKALGVDDKHIVLDDDGNFAGVNVKIDDVISTVGLKDLIAGYQTTKSYTQKTQALAEEKRNFDSIKTQVADAYTKKLDNVESITKYLQTKIVSDFSNIDWQTLRVQEPGEYAALVQDYNLRQAEIAKVLEAVDQERQQETQQMTQAQMQAHQAFLAEQASKLIEKNPEWSDPQKLKGAFNSLQQFVEESYGFTPAEFMQVQDHRLIELVKDAQKYRQGIKIADKKVIKIAPKFQKSSGKTKQTNTKLEQLLKRASEAKGSNKRAAETDAITELLLTGG